ncbi:MAG TPA: DsrE family protein [Afifellaceae bacterium]|nr:DsrE family protein [Afifellaceae bacterium]
MKKLMILAAAMAVALFSASGAFSGEKMKVVYHVSELEKVNFTLGNIANHIKGVGGPENVEIILVTHGPALKAFHDMNADEKVSKRVETLQSQGVKFEACGNTMQAQAVSLEDLLPNMFQRDEGGVVRIAELQSKGYIYIRP